MAAGKKRCRSLRLIFLSKEQSLIIDFPTLPSGHFTLHTGWAEQGQESACHPKGPFSGSTLTSPTVLGIQNIFCGRLRRVCGT